MKTRDKTLSVKLTEEELLQAHALANLGDESVGRYLRRVISREYERSFGSAPAPAAVTRMGRPRKAVQQ